MKRFVLTLALLCTTMFQVSNFKIQVSELHAQERGFIHPGGLHTQADFDRVKAQLAAGNTKVKQAYAKLKAAGYAQPGVQTYPVETIVRGGGNGENYMNAARGAAMAYQNALRWKIEDNEACAKAAVRILMAWANTTKGIGGDSNYALASGLYGYAFAQAAELVRDYEGWSREDFAMFQQWMLHVWYPSSLGFLRGRNGSWENAGKWWQAPGHYWSNWGLCNAICVASIGILCDDVFIYNQGMSFFKYDQVGNYTNPPTLHEVTGHGDADGGKCIHNDGLTEFLGNFVVTTSEVSGSKFQVSGGAEVEAGAYVEMGQLNESGRDAGHSSMSLGLAVDLAKIGWNQGDDLFAYMDHRLAAGIEYLAAQTQSAEGLPWTDYMYGTNGFYYSDGRAWLMTGPALGAQMRPYWGTVIGIYEGVKGVKMPFSERSYAQMGIDEGAQGSTSGGYDHMGYSVLMNTRDEQLCPADRVPTELTPKMEYSGSLTTNLVPSIAKERARGLVSGKTLLHNELGGLVNTFAINNNTTVPAGQTLTLMPQLPEGEEDTGQWQWNTGETSRDISVSTDHSFIYRVTYTNKNGVESQLCFPIAAKGDCTPDALTPGVTIDGESVSIGETDGHTDPIEILYGKTATLSVTPSVGWGTFKWSTGATTQTITTSAIRKDQDISVTFTNQGGATTTMVFHFRVLMAIPYYTIGETTTTPLSHRGEAGAVDVIVDQSGSVTLGLTTPTSVAASKVSWSQRMNEEFVECATGSKTLTLEDVQTSGEYVASFTLGGEEQTFIFYVFVKSAEATIVEPGNYLIQDVKSGRLLTGHGKNQLVTFEGVKNEGVNSEKLDGQTWFIDMSGSRYAIVNLPDSLGLTLAAKLTAAKLYSFFLDAAVGTDRYALHSGASASSAKYWAVNEDGEIDLSSNKLTAFPFRLIRVDNTDGIEGVESEERRVKSEELRGNNEESTIVNVFFDLCGRQITNSSLFTPHSSLPKGVYIVNGKKVVVCK